MPRHVDIHCIPRLRLYDAERKTRDTPSPRFPASQSARRA
jgi:hypothetical protein